MLFAMVATPDVSTCFIAAPFAELFAPVVSCPREHALTIDAGCSEQTQAVFAGIAFCLQEHLAHVRLGHAFPVNGHNPNLGVVLCAATQRANFDGQSRGFPDDFGSQRAHLYVHFLPAPLMDVDATCLRCASAGLGSVLFVLVLDSELVQGELCEGIVPYVATGALEIAKHWIWIHAHEVEEATVARSSLGWSHRSHPSVYLRLFWFCRRY